MDPVFAARRASGRGAAQGLWSTASRHPQGHPRDQRGGDLSHNRRRDSRHRQRSSQAVHIRRAQRRRAARRDVGTQGVAAAAARACGAHTRGAVLVALLASAGAAAARGGAARDPARAAGESLSAGPCRRFPHLTHANLFHVAPPCRFSMSLHAPRVPFSHSRAHRP